MPYIRPATATCHVVKMATSISNTDAESTVIQSSENVDSVDSEGAVTVLVVVVVASGQS